MPIIRKCMMVTGGMIGVMGREQSLFRMEMSLGGSGRYNNRKEASIVKIRMMWKRVSQLQNVPKWRCHRREANGYVEGAGIHKSKCSMREHYLHISVDVSV